MPTVSDLLAIELRLDTSGMAAGQRAAEQSLTQTRRVLQQQGDDIERIAKSIGANVETALRNMAALFGVVLSFEGFRKLVVQAVDAGTSLGRFAESIDSTAEKVGELEQAFQRAGLRSESVRGVLQKMKLDIQNVRTGGPIPQWMNLLGQAPFNMGGLQFREPEEILLTASQRAQGMAPSLAAQWLGSLGLSPQDLTLLTKPGELQRQLEAVRAARTAPTTPQVEAAERLTEKFASLEQLSGQVLRDFVVLTEPFLRSVLDFTAGVLKWVHRIERWFGGAPTSEEETDSWLQSRYGRFSGGGSTGGMVGTRPGFGGYRPRQTEHVTNSPPTSAPPPAPGGGSDYGGVRGSSSATHIGGTIDVEGRQYRFGSGGAGYASIPAGDYPITPGTVGPWGRAHGAMGINNNRIWDDRLHRYREGIEFHSGSSDRLITEGCMAIAGNQWPAFKAQVLDMIHRYGSAYLHVGPNGASVTRGSSTSGAGTTVRGSTFNDATTASGLSAATTAGIALPSGGKMGDRYEVTTPDGRKFVTRLIDRGPAAWTGRGVDISAPLAAQMGYGRDFPTDAQFQVRPLSPQSLLRVPDVTTGAAAAAQAEQTQHVTNHNEAVTSVQQVTVNTHARDASGIAEDVKTELGRVLGE